MKCVTPEISWHGRDPIYSVDFQYLKGTVLRLATSGTDQLIRIWAVKYAEDGQVSVEFLSSLNRHTRAVNCVRFSPDGQVLASAGDDSVVMLWRLNAMPTGSGNIFQEDDAENKENWSVFKVLRSHLEDIYDICWSSCGKYMLSGSVDNSAILWDVRKGVRLGLFPDHKSFVQGVAFDPLTEYLVTLSSDRFCRVYSFESKNNVHTISKLTIPTANNNSDDERNRERTVKMFHDDTMKSFFRRLCFSPCGSFLFVPAGCIDKAQGTSDEVTNTTYIFARSNLAKPCMHLPGPPKATLAVRCCPTLFKLREIPRKTPLVNPQNGTPNADNTTTQDESNNASQDQLADWQKYETMFELSYRVVFAVATEDAVLLYDTQQPQPFGYITNIHYHTLSDLGWSPDGRCLVVSSTDGFCSMVTFEEGELGTPIEDQVVKVYTEEEIAQREEERQMKKEKKKKKSSGKEGKENVQNTSVPEIDIAEIEKDTVTTSATPSPVPTKCDTDSKSNQSEPMDTSTAAKTESPAPQSSDSKASSKDQPVRRVALTSLSTASPTTSDAKQPRRIQMTSLPLPTPSSNNSSPDKSNSSESQQSTTSDSINKTPRRRVQLTSLGQSTPSTPTTPANSAKDDAANTTPKRVTSQAEAKDVVSTPTSSKKDTSQEAGMKTPTTQSAKKTPRRVMLNTLSTPTREGKAEAPVKQDKPSESPNDGNLCLQLETTQDSTQPTSSTTNQPNLASPSVKSSAAPPSSPAVTPASPAVTASPAAAGERTPRRIKPVMLAVGSPKSPSVSSNSGASNTATATMASPQPRRVPLKTISTPTSKSGGGDS